MGILYYLYFTAHEQRVVPSESKGAQSVVLELARSTEAGFKAHKGEKIIRTQPTQLKCTKRLEPAQCLF